MKSNYFKIGDKFDYGKGGIIRKEYDAKGVEKTSFFRLGADFVGCTLIPGVGIKSPEPENLILLSDGSFIDMKAKQHIIVGSSGAITRDPLDFDENGIATISLNGHGDLLIGKESGKIMSKEDKKELEEIEVKEDLINKISSNSFSLVESISSSKKVSFDLMADNSSSYDVETVVKENGKDITVTSKMEITKTLDSMFKITDNKNQEVASLIEKDGEYYLDFASTTEIDEYLATAEGQKIVPSLMATGEGKNKKYMFKVDKVTLTTSSGFHIEALGGALKYECNGAATAVTLGKKAFVEKIIPSPEGKKSQKATGYSATMSTTFLDSVRLKKGPFSFAKSNKEGILKDIDGIAQHMSVDQIIGLLNLGEVKDGVKHFKGEGLEIMGTTIDTAPSGKEKSGKTNVLLVKEGNETYVLHDGKLVPLQHVNSKTNSMIGYYKDTKKPTNMALEFSPKKGSEGKTVVLPFLLGKKNEVEVSPKLNAIVNFVARDGSSTIEPEKRTNLFENMNDTDSRLDSRKMKIKSTSTIKEPEVVKYPEQPEKKKEEKTNKDPGPTGDNNGEKKGDDKDKQKKATGFWDVISNSCFLSMAIFAMMGMFGLGAIAFPLMVGFMVAGAFTKTLAWQGGFSGIAKKVKERKEGKDGNDKSKSKSKEKLKEKYNNQNKDISKSQELVDAYEKLLKSYEAKGQQNSKEAKNIKKLLKKERKNLKKLNKSKNKLLKKKPIAKLALLGEKPDINSHESYRDGFDNDEIQNSITKDILEDSLKPVKKKPGKNKIGKNTTKLLDNLTIEERAVVFGNIEEIDKKYGGDKNNIWINKLIKRDYLKSREKLTPAQQKELEELNKDLDKAKTDLGEKTYKEWESYIKNEAIQKQNKLAKEYGISGVDLFTIRENQVKIYKLERKGKLTDAEKEELKLATEAVNKAKSRIAEYGFAEERKAMLAKIENDPSIAPEEREELVKRYNDPEYAKEVGNKYIKSRYPKLIAELNPVDASRASTNPITARRIAVNSHIADLDHRDHIESYVPYDIKPISKEKTISSNVKNVVEEVVVTVKINLAKEAERKAKEEKDRVTTELSEKYNIDLASIEKDSETIRNLSAKSDITEEEKILLADTIKRKNEKIKELGKVQYNKLLEIEIEKLAAENKTWIPRTVRDKAIKRLKNGKTDRELKLSLGQSLLDEITVESNGLLSFKDSPTVTSVYDNDEKPHTAETPVVYDSLNPEDKKDKKKDKKGKDITK